jgi:hypothetical protein
MMSRHAATVARERTALASSVRALVAFLPAPGEHAQDCLHEETGRCSRACREGRAALQQAREVLFPWRRARDGSP